MGFNSVKGWACAAALFVASTPAISTATIVTLTDRNSSATFNLDNDGGNAGQQTWFVDGATDQMKQQWFWYRIGALGGESRIDTLSASASIVSDGDFDPGTESLTVQYLSAGVAKVTITYELTGGLPGSGASDLGELIAIDNLSGAPLDFHFFQYVDFDLSATPGDDIILLSGSPVNTANQNDATTTSSETVVTSNPDQYLAGSAAVLSALLNDAAPTSAGAFAGPAGPGDVAWIFQWDVVIPANSSFLISKDKALLVPEPAALALFGFAAAGGLLRRRRTR